MYACLCNNCDEHSSERYYCMQSTRQQKRHNIDSSIMWIKNPVKALVISLYRQRQPPKLPQAPVPNSGTRALTLPISDINVQPEFGIHGKHHGWIWLYVLCFWSHSFRAVTCTDCSRNRPGPRSTQGPTKDCSCCSPGPEAPKSFNRFTSCTGCSRRCSRTTAPGRGAWCRSGRTWRRSTEARHPGTHACKH